MSTTTKTEAEESGPSQETTAEVARRLVVELSPRGANDVAWLMNEEQLNKTTLVNRAVQVYRAVMEAQAEGKRLMIADADGKNAQVLWIM